MLRIGIACVLLILFVPACTSPAPAPTAPPAPAAPTVKATLVPGVYHSLEKGDLVEDQPVDYFYNLPSNDAPVVQIAFGENLLNLVNINPKMQADFVAFIREIIHDPHTVLAYDENDPNQGTPKQMTIQPNRPVQIVVIKMPDGLHHWSDRDIDQNNVRDAFKIIRRVDGGLRYVMAYDITALNNFKTIMPQGLGGGLILSSRIALLKMILSDSRYQDGDNVLDAYPPDLGKYDPRVLKTDPSKQGLAQDVDWILVSRPVPNPGMQAP